MKIDPGVKIPYDTIRGSGSSWNLAFCGPNNVLQTLQIIKCFWKKNPINFLFRVQISPRSCIMDFFLQFLFWIFQSRLLMDSPPYLNKNKFLRTTRAMVKALLSKLKLLKIFCWLCPFLFHNTLACVGFFYYQ